MRKKLGLFAVLAIVLVGAAACKQTMTETESGEKGNTESVGDESEEIAVHKTEYGAEELHLKGKKLELPTVMGTEHEFYCNLEENMKIECNMEMVPVLVCRDPVYGITYYVNYGRDNFIYAYRDGEKELAVAISARDLYCRKGELYFIADSDGQYQFSGFAQGNILKYNPADGTVVVVEECNADGMVVYQDGICYRITGEIKQYEGLYTVKEERFFLSFATGESTAFPKNVDKLRRWNGYLLQMQMGVREISESDPLVQKMLAQGYTIAGVGGVDAINLVDMQGNIQETWQNVKDFPKECWVNGDSVYYVEQRETDGETGNRCVLRRYDTQTGMHEDVAVLDYPTNLLLSDIMIHQGIVYFGNGLRVTIDQGTQCYMQSADSSAVKFGSFFTDGEKLFCVSNGKLWRLEERPETPIAVREFVDGVPLEIGTYVYRLYEP